jgi:hypothetical protein
LRRDFPQWLATIACLVCTHTRCETNGQDARYVFMPEKKPSPMPTQPLDDGRDIPQQMRSRVRVIGPKQPERNDSERCAKVRANALKKQREALRN